MSLPFDCPVCGHKKSIPQTNADRIRAMSDEELAEWIDFCPHVRCPRESCETCLLAWLKQPAEEMKEK